MKGGAKKEDDDERDEKEEEKKKKKKKKKRGRIFPSAPEPYPYAAPTFIHILTFTTELNHLI